MSLFSSYNRSEKIRTEPPGFSQLFGKRLVFSKNQAPKNEMPDDISQLQNLNIVFYSAPKLLFSQAGRQFLVFIFRVVFIEKIQEIFIDHLTVNFIENFMTHIFIQLAMDILIPAGF